MNMSKHLITSLNIKLCFIAFLLLLVSIAYGKSPVSGYVQVQYKYNFLEDAVPNNEFQIRRGRIKFRYMITDKILTSIEIDCGRGSLTPKDIYVEYELNHFLNFVIGQHKMPISLGQLHSARRLLVIDRGEVNDVFKDYGYLGRDIGISIQGEILKRNSPLRYAFGVFNGNGYQVAGDNDNTKQFVQRLTFGPVGNISIGINSTQRADSVTQDVMIAYGGDICYKKGALSIEGEILSGDTESGATMVGFYTIAAYRIGCFEPAIKVERLYLDSDDTSNYLTIYTCNAGLYFHRNMRLQANLIAHVPQDQKSYCLFVIQAQASF
jgi:hypothetical protein